MTSGAMKNGKETPTSQLEFDVELVGSLSCSAVFDRVLSATSVDDFWPFRLEVLLAPPFVFSVFSETSGCEGLVTRSAILACFGSGGGRTGPDLSLSVGSGARLAAAGGGSPAGCAGVGDGLLRELAGAGGGSPAGFVGDDEGLLGELAGVGGCSLA
jgi:hypothetical protein